jgi:type IX secretion system PorP/SprF family membrane protein
MKARILLWIMLVPIFCQAQQDPIYSQYLLNPFVLNPAYAGLNNNLNAMVGYRVQWAGFEGQPNTFNGSVHSSFRENKIGAGLLFINDKIGNITNTEVNAAVAYKINLKESVFSFALQAGFQNYSTDNSELNIYDPSDYAFLGGERGSRINFGVGAIIKSERYVVGLSVPRLLPTTFKNGGQEFQLYDQHYYLMGSYIYFLNENIRLKPSILFRGVSGAPASVDLAFNINLNQVHTAGIFTRNLKTYGLLFQTLLKEKYRFGYVFEVPTNQSVGVKFTTHEITVGVMLSAFSFHEKSLSNF